MAGIALAGLGMILALPSFAEDRMAPGDSAVSLEAGPQGQASTDAETDEATDATAPEAGADGENEVIEMEEVTVTAEAPRPVAPTVSTRSAEDIDDLPTAGDPFEAIRYEDAVVEESALADPGYTLADTVMGFTRKNRAFSVYGADSDFNSYYFDFIRIPTNKHDQLDAPIVSTWMMEGLDVYKGIAPLERGPGIGGTFVSRPIGTLDADRRFIVSPDSSLFGFAWKQRLGGDSGLVLGASKSLTELTYPLLFKGEQLYMSLLGFPIIDDALAVPSFGDLCARLFLARGANRLDVDLLGFYDLSIMTMDFAGRYDMRGRALPYFVAGGAQWTFDPKTEFRNSAYAYASWQDRESSTVMDLDFEDYLRESFVRMGMTEEEITEALASVGSTMTGSLSLADHPRVRVLAAEGGEKAAWRVDERLSLEAGASLRYSRVSGSYEGFIDSDMTIYGMPFLEGGYEVPGASMSDSTLKAHVFARARLDLGEILSGLGAGATWLPFHGSILPSIEADCSWEPSARLYLGGRAGWSAAYYDEFAFAERRLNEEILELEDDSSYARLPRSVAAAAEAAYGLDEHNILRLEPYGAYYYDLSGLALYASWIDPYAGESGGDIFERTNSLDPDIGRSLGATAGWERAIDAEWSSSLSLTAASTLYRSRGGGEWFRSNSDTPLTLKYALMRRKEGGTEFTATLNCYAGKPFTPEIVQSPGVLAKEPFNSAADWVPRTSIGLNVKWDSTFWKLKGRYEFNCVNLLAFFSPTLAGMKESAMANPGASTRDFSNREYDWLNTDFMTLFSAMKLKFGGTYFF